MRTVGYKVDAEERKEDEQESENRCECDLSTVLVCGSAQMQEDGVYYPGGGGGGCFRVFNPFRAVSAQFCHYHGEDNRCGKCQESKSYLLPHKQVEVSQRRKVFVG